MGNLTERAAPEPGVAPAALVAIAIVPSSAPAHIFDTTHVVIRGAGGTGKLSILDPTGCLATITVTSADPDVATASPAGPVVSAFQSYEVTAGADPELDTWASSRPCSSYPG